MSCFFAIPADKFSLPYAFKRVLAEFDRQKLQPQILHYSPNLSSVWNIVQQGIALSILTGNGILPDSDLIAIPIEGLAQKGFIVTKKGRQIYADERCLIDFVRRKFTDTLENTNSPP